MVGKHASEPSVVMVPNQPEMQRRISVDNMTSKRLGKMLRKHVYPLNKYAAYHRSGSGKIQLRSKHVSVEACRPNLPTPGAHSVDTASERSETSQTLVEDKMADEQSQAKLIVVNGQLTVKDDSKPTGLYSNVSGVEKEDDERGSSVCDRTDIAESVPDGAPVDSHSNCSSALTDWDQNISCTSDNSNMLTTTGGSSVSPGCRSEVHSANPCTRLQIKVEPESDESLMVSDVQELSAMEQCGNRVLSDLGVMSATQLDQYSTHMSDTGQNLMTIPDSGNMYIATQDSSSVYYREYVFYENGKCLFKLL